jgi:hypothetical protein
MERCTIDAVEVEMLSVTVDPFMFGKISEQGALMDFVLELPSQKLVMLFSNYYADFIKPEKEDDDVAETYEGVWEKLRSTGYCALDKMVDSFPDILSQMLLEILPTEFMGYLFLESAKEFNKRRYILETLNSVNLSAGLLVCTGKAVYNPTFMRR